MKIRQEPLAVHEQAMRMDCFEEYVRAAEALAEHVKDLG